MSWQLSPEPVQVSHAREQARKAMFDWGLGEHSDLAELIVTELVTNAIRHGEGDIQVCMRYTSAGLRVEVHDEGAGRPVRRRATIEDETGHGLQLLDGLIELEGGERGLSNDRTGYGKTVHVVIGLPHDVTGTR